ncbi:MAG: hypothetical protein WCB46_10710 [Methanoregula sp.]
MVHDFLTLSADEIRKNPNLVTSRYFTEIRGSRAETVILSSEEFENLNSGIASLREYLIPEFNVKVIFYVRRQDEMIESLYNQRIKSPKIHSGMKFADFFSQLMNPAEQYRSGNKSIPARNDRLDYYSLLLPWKNAFGMENILVRCYEQEQLSQGLYEDFMNAIGCGFDRRYRVPSERVNASLPLDHLEIIRICNDQFNGDENIHTFLLRTFKTMNAGKTFKRQYLLSPGQRREILSFYETSNEKIAREFLGRSDGRLFYAPLPDVQEPWEPYEGLTVEKIVPIFTEILFNMDLERNSLKRRMRMTIKKIGTTLGLLPTMEYWYTRFHRT